MNILSIETSCDETAISIIKADGDFDNATFTIQGDTLLSQVDIHKEYGGVYPMLAKREHSKNLIPLLEKTLKEANMYECTGPASDTSTTNKVLEKILTREPELLKQSAKLFAVLKKPDIDAIAVTYGPGLEPALWVGINFARALSTLWNIPVIPINHMEGHIFSALLTPKEEDGETKEVKETFTIQDTKFPILALLISGGHTELVLAKDWLEYEVIGETRDDAVGEAFDKVARMLDLPYPGGPEISRLAEHSRITGHRMSSNSGVELPRPMIHTDDYDFSFSGIKTSVLYKIKEMSMVDDATKKAIACEFENAVTDVLIAKTKKALDQYGTETLIISGGVSANKHIRKTFTTLIQNEYPEITLSIPDQKLATDNAIMIGIAGYFRWLKESGKIKKQNPNDITANGNLRL